MADEDGSNTDGQIEGSGEAGQTEGTATATNVTLNVHGQDRLVTPEERDAAAQKWYAGDDTLKKASEITKTNAEAAQLLADIKLVKERKDPEAFRRVAAVLGADAGLAEDTLARSREAALAAHRGETSAGSAAGTTEDAGAGSGELDEARIVEAVVAKLRGSPAEVGLENLSAPIKEFLESTAQGQLDTVVDKALDSDPILSTIMTGENETRKKAVRSMALKEVRRRAQTGQKVLAGQGIQEALQTVRAELEALGVGASGTIPHEMGLGSAPGTAGALHQKTPIERPKGGQSDPHFVEYLTDKIARNMAEDS